MTPQEFAKRIKLLRAKSGLNQRELAEFAGLHYNTIYKIEKGTYTVNLDTLNRLAVVFGIKLFELLRQEPEK